MAHGTMLIPIPALYETAQRSTWMEMIDVQAQALGSMLIPALYEKAQAPGSSE